MQAIADHKRDKSPNKIEQLILFPTDTGFVRLAPDHPELVTRIFGHEEWKEIYGAASARRSHRTRRAASTSSCTHADLSGWIPHRAGPPGDLTCRPAALLPRVRDRSQGRQGIMDHVFDESGCRRFMTKRSGRAPCSRTGAAPPPSRRRRRGRGVAAREPVARASRHTFGHRGGGHRLSMCGLPTA